MSHAITVLPHDSDSRCDHCDALAIIRTREDGMPLLLCGECAGFAIPVSEVLEAMELRGHQAQAQGGGL